VVNILRRYGWPGNLRELRNVIERAMILKDDDLITTNWLPRSVTPEAQLTVMRKISANGLPATTIDSRRTFNNENFRLIFCSRSSAFRCICDLAGSASQEPSSLTRAGSRRRPHAADIGANCGYLLNRYIRLAHKTVKTL
jgi:DNA-binding NtrC family response regulator